MFAGGLAKRISAVVLLFSNISHSGLQSASGNAHGVGVTLFADVLSPMLPQSRVYAYTFMYRTWNVVFFDLV